MDYFVTIKYPDESDLEGEKIYLGSWLKGGHSGRRHGGGGVMTHSQSGSRELGTLVLSSLSPQVWDSRPESVPRNPRGVKDRKN